MYESVWPQLYSMLCVYDNGCHNTAMGFKPMFLVLIKKVCHFRRRSNLGLFSHSIQDKGVYQHLWCYSVGGPPHTSNPQHPIPPLARLSPRLIFHLSPVNWSGPTNSFGQLYKNSLTRKPIRNTIFCDALRSHVSEGSKGWRGGAYRPVFMHLCAPPVSGSGGAFAPTSSLLPPISALCVDEDLPFHLC